MTWKRFVSQASTLWTWLPCSRGASAAVLMMGRIVALYRSRPLHPSWQLIRRCAYKIAGTLRSRRLTVGVAGFEPTASSSRTKRATKLRHTPVPFEYSVSSPIIPNGDQASGISVSHAALDWSVGGCLARNRRDANTLATPGIHMSRRRVYVCGYAGYTCRSDASGRVAMRTFA